MNFCTASLALVVVLCGPLSGQVHAAPPTPVSGGASLISDGDSSLILTDSSLLEWSRFSVAAGKTVDFVQASDSSGILNRVQDGAILEVFGVLRSNRPLTFIAGNIYVAPGGVIDAPGLSLVASQTVNMAGLIRGGGKLNIEAPSIFVKGPLVSDGVLLQAGDFQGSGSLSLGSDGGSFSALTMTMVNFELRPSYMDYSAPSAAYSAHSDFAFELASLVPEPTPVAMLAAGMLMLFALRRKGIRIGAEAVR